MNIQWYPGHMTKAKRMMQEDIKLIDIVIELLDARVPMSSKNPDIDQLANNKFRLIVLNKVDLADERITVAWEKYYKDKGFAVIKLNSKSGAGIKSVTSVVQEACKEKIERDRKRGILNRPIRAMIVGIPNVGKSTFINSFSGKACTKVGNRPGVTKGKQWIKINKNVELLDTPGILWPRFDDEKVGLDLAMIGSINDNIINTTELAMELIKALEIKYCNIISERYNIEIVDDDGIYAVKMLEGIARVRQCKLKGDELDLDKAALILLDDYRNGKLGRISLEAPED